MTASNTKKDDLEAVLPASRHRPAGYARSWHFRANSKLRVRNIVATRLATAEYDCWTLEAAPASIDEPEWTTLDIGSNPNGGAVFCRGPLIDRLWPRPEAMTPGLHCIERLAESDHQGVETDRHPARMEDGSTIRYLADGSMTVVDDQS